jgi:uncharacterized 2Fe-2S/4Fe-4S cluster protein (DUF4445 family)
MNVVIQRPGLPEVAWPLRPGSTILDVLREAGLAAAVHTPCGGKGTCRKCAVLVDGEEALACLVRPERGCVVVLPEVRPQVICTGGLRMRYAVDPPVREGFGIAADIGTTTVVLYVHELRYGNILNTIAEPNRQSVYGADVVSRMKAAEEGSAPAITDIVRGQLNDLARRASPVNEGPPSAWTIAGNTVMQHFLCGLDTAGIARAPFTPASLFGGDIPARELNLWASAATSRRRL